MFILAIIITFLGIIFFQEELINKYNEDKDGLLKFIIEATN